MSRLGDLLDVIRQGREQEPRFPTSTTFLVCLNLFLVVLGLHCYEGFPLVLVHGLLITVASLVSEHSL